MADHEELVAELQRLEKLSAPERLEVARRRRSVQLESWRKTKQNEELFPPKKMTKSHRKLKFESSIELIEASARNDAEEVKELLNSGISPDLQNLDGLSALHQAVIEDCEDVVHTLIEHGATVNIRDADLWTPLHAAVACGNVELVKYLVQHGASLVAINADGNMPIDLVEDNEEVEIHLDKKMTEEGYTEEELDNIRNAVSDQMLSDLQESIDNGGDLNVRDEMGATAMHIAAANGYLDVIEFLLAHKAKIDSEDRDGWQPIHAASCWGQDEALEILYRNGADLDAKTNDGESPIDLTEDEDLQEFIRELKISGRKINMAKRSPSNQSSRSLVVRRSSIVDKHKMSINDAKKEKDFLHVVINPDQDNSDSESIKRESISNEVKTEANPTPSSSNLDDSDEKLESPLRNEESHGEQKTSSRSQPEKSSPAQDSSSSTGRPNVSSGSEKSDHNFERKETVEISVDDGAAKINIESSEPSKAEANSVSKESTKERAPQPPGHQTAEAENVASPKDVVIETGTDKEENVTPSKNTAKPSNGKVSGKDSRSRKKCCLIC